jgi:16S rRNA (cytidine1402-2'-O)-methyltransferase
MSKLYVVATPIGHLDDITVRALEVLRSVSVVYAEDTRVSKKLLSHHSITAKVISLHEHNEQGRIDEIVSRINQGEDCALISDAGTPLISDPGFVVVRALREQGVSVVPLPGACAAIAALSVSGLPTDRFLFCGFLPAKSQARVVALKGCASEKATLVFYESTHRIMAMLQDVAAVFGDRAVVLGRELTKTFEAIVPGTSAEVLAWLEEEAARQKGEFVVLIAPADKAAAKLQLDSDVLLDYLLAELPGKTAAKIVAKITGEPKAVIYEKTVGKKRT